MQEAPIEDPQRTEQHAIFKAIPFECVVKQTEFGEEKFNLYQLGKFSATDHSVFSLFGSSNTVEENLELVELQAKTFYKPHFHKKSSAIIYISLGEGIFILGNEQLKYQPGTRIVIPAGTLHGFQTTTQTLFLSIQSPSIIDPTTGEIDIHYDGEVTSND